MEPKSFVKVSVALVLIICIFSVGSERWAIVSASSPPTKLKVYLGPSKVLADRGVYESVLVQLLDSQNKPARAPEDIIVSLSSSKTDIGSVDPSIIISRGETCASAQFFSTYTPGLTTITAVASGYTSGQAIMTTVGPTPSKLAVYCYPPKLPNDAGVYESVIVQLQDSQGSPARAPIGDVNVTLSSSDISVGTVDNWTIISSGSTYAVAKFYTTTTQGSTTLTAISSGYSSGAAVMITSGIGAQPPLKLKVYVGPPKITAAGVTHESICVELQDSSGKVARAPANLTIALSSSDISVGTVDSTMTIQYNDAYGLAKFYSTYRSGSTTITAAASGYDSGETTMTTVGPIPSRLAVYPLPSAVPADKQEYSIAVQLQDSSGVPARDPIGPVIVTLSSSNTAIGNVDATTTINFGLTHSTTKFYSAYTAGSVTITAMSAGYTSGDAPIYTYVIDPPLTVSVTTHPNYTASGEQTSIRVYVTEDAQTLPAPVSGATVELTSSIGGNFSYITDERNGNYTAVFTAPTVDTKTVATITATASKSGYAGGEGEVVVVVDLLGVGGDLLISVQDLDGTVLSDATVTSISQPSGQPQLSGITNITGHVMFSNVKAGTYVIQANKTGYDTTSHQITVIDGQTASNAINLAPSAPGFFESTLIWVLLAVILVIIVIVTVLILKRRSGGEAGFVSRKQYEEYYSTTNDSGSH